MERTAPRPVVKTRYLTTVSCAVLALGLFAAPPATADDEPDAGASNGVVGPNDAVFRQGMWWEPSRSGSGWDLSRIGDFLFAVWYTYDADGEPIWYTAGANLDGNRFEGELLQHRWSHADGARAAPEAVGTLVIEFPHPQRAVVEWQLGETSGTRLLQPFRFASDPTLNDYSGTWYDPGESGYGVTLQTQGEHTFAVIYHYDAAGAPTWRTGAGRDGALRFDLTRARGACPACEHVPSEHEAAGALQLEFNTETRLRATLDTTDGSWDRADAGWVMISDPPSGRPHAAAMASLASTDALRYFFRTAWERTDSFASPVLCLPAIVSPAPPPATDGSGQLSGTNVQEAGVDEADTVKTTADQLFVLDHLDYSLPRVGGDEERRRQSISRYRISPDAGAPAFETRYHLTYPPARRPLVQNVGQGLYHHAAEDGASQLVYLGSQVEGNCWGTGLASARLVSWDTGDGADTDADTDLVLDGEIIASRRIGDQLFVLSSWQPDFHAIAEEVLPPEEIKSYYTAEEFLAILRNADADKLLPQMRSAQGVTRPLVDAENIMVPPLPAGRLAPQLSVLSLFSLADLDAPPKSMAILGYVDGLYASTESVWLASARSHLEITDEGRVIGTGFRDTDLHRFAIEGDEIRYAGSGTVEGSVGHDPGRLAFRLSEWNGALRVLTHSNSWEERWGELGSNRLTVLSTEANEELLLGTRAVLPNADRPTRIGKPGESVFAVRFFGERGYVVTFLRIDPLYALDLADPDDPFVLGELEIPGFSDYLHPVGTDLLLGVGKDVEIVDPGTPSERTVEKGVQIGLFDVAEPGAPVQLDVDLIGYRGTSTPVDQTHLAFTWLPGDPDAGRPPRFTLPVAEHAPVDGEELNPGQIYPWKATGAAMYEIAVSDDDAWLDRLGIAEVANRDDVPEEHVHFYQYLYPESVRAVIYGDRLLFTHLGGLFSTDWGGQKLEPAEQCDRCIPWEADTTP